MRLIFSLLMLLFAAPANAQLTMGGGKAGSAINGFSYCRPVVVDHTKIPNTVVPASDLSNSVVLVDSKTNVEFQAELKLVANGGVVTDAQGDDIVFYPDAGAAGTKLDFKRVIYNGTTGEAIFRVRRDLSHTVSDVFYVCAGKAAITTSQESTAVYHSSYKGVWDFGDGMTLSLADSTSNATTGTNVNSATAIAGKVGGAVHFTRASNQRITLGNPAALSGIADSRTISFWFHLDTIPTTVFPASGAFSIYFKNGEDGGMGLFIGGGSTGGAIANLGSGPAGAMTIREGVASMAGDTKHVAFVYNRAIHTAYLYVNCALVATYDYYPAAQNVDQDASIGGFGATSAFDGWVDELTASDVARPHDYVVAHCLMETNPALMVNVGPRL